MSDDINTNGGEDLNEDAKITVRVNISETDAADILAQLNANFPAIADLDEIHLMIYRKTNEET